MDIQPLAWRFVGDTRMFEKLASFFCAEVSEDRAVLRAREISCPERRYSYRDFT